MNRSPNNIVSQHSEVEFRDEHMPESSRVIADYGDRAELYLDVNEDGNGVSICLSPTHARMFRLHLGHPEEARLLREGFDPIAMGM